MEDFEGDAAVDLDAESIGKGMAKSRDDETCLTGDLKGDLLDDLVGDVGDEGVARIVAEAEDLGEDEASRRVSVEGFEGVISCGRSAMWGFGMGIVPECS
jgi:hypothetical protein